MASCLSICKSNECPFKVAETVHQLLEIVSAYESALDSAHTSTRDVALGTEDSDLGPVLAAVLDPLVEACSRSAEALTPDAPSRVDEITKLDPTAHRYVWIHVREDVIKDMISTIYLEQELAQFYVLATSTGCT